MDEISEGDIGTQFMYGLIFFLRFKICESEKVK